MSVITIFYNAEQYFAAAIESVLAQDFEGFELLLVDDGSSDRSTAMAKEYADRHPDRVRYLDHPGHANRGMSATRNVGFAAARGDLIAFIDSDDRWSPSKLSEQVAIMDRFPDVDLVCGAANYWRSWDGGPDELVPTGHIQNRPIPPGEATLALYPLGKAAAPCPSDIMVRRKAALALGGFEESFTGPLQMYEDQAFLAKLYLEHSVYFSDRVWLDYRIHDKSCVAEVSAGVSTMTCASIFCAGSPIIFLSIRSFALPRSTARSGELFRLTACRARSGNLHERCARC